jgi:hypothetical protein
MDWNESATTQISYSGRRLELSTLSLFNDKIFACDGHTGIIFELPLNATHPVHPQPWDIFTHGDDAPFKCEWTALKDGDLWVGGHGVRSSDENKNENQKFVKRITTKGEVTESDWLNYDQIGEALEVTLQVTTANKKCYSFNLNN